MSKGDSRYEVMQRRVLFAEKGTELKISPLLEGIRTLSGEKIQWYLASELRDRIRDAQVRVTCHRQARAQAIRSRTARNSRDGCCTNLPAVRTLFGDAYAELYLAEPNEPRQVALTRVGTRVIEESREPAGTWSCTVDLALRAGTDRCTVPESDAGHHNGIIHDERYAALLESLKPLETQPQRRSSRNSNAQKTSKRASNPCARSRGPFTKQCLRCRGRSTTGSTSRDVPEANGVATTAQSIPARRHGSPGRDHHGVAEPTSSEEGQRQFFDYAGPLYSVIVSPASSTMSINERDASGCCHVIDRAGASSDELTFAWEIVEGEGSFDNTVDQEVEFTATGTPGLVRLHVIVTQREVTAAPRLW